jgi:phage FluMu gp28-like protein
MSAKTHNATRPASRGRTNAGASKLTPGGQLLPYQRDWVDDQSRWKFGLMARQVGKDFSSGFEGIADCYMAECRKQKTTWLIASPSERQSLEALEKWKDWAEAFKITLAGEEQLRESHSESMLKSASITFEHGSRIIAVPGKPETVRGFSANVLLTEFAFFEQPEATWRAILPTITNEIKGVKKVRIITTPNGMGNKAHEIWRTNYFPGDDARQKTAKWSCHFVDIYTAVKQGLKASPEDIREALNDPEGWAEEFECLFLDQSATLLSYELIASCESPEATTEAPYGYWIANAAHHSDRIVMGIDFGRKKDLTVAWSTKKVGDVQQTIEVLEMENTSTPRQVEALRPRLARVHRACLDYTGPGIGLGDYLVKEFGEWNPRQHKFGKIELCSFTADFKCEIFSKLRIAFESKKLRVPQSRNVREDLHSISRTATNNGQVTYRAAHTATGHADRCTALALATRAADYVQEPVRVGRMNYKNEFPWYYPDARKIGIPI